MAAFLEQSAPNALAQLEDQLEDHLERTEQEIKRG